MPTTSHEAASPLARTTNRNDHMTNQGFDDGEWQAQERAATAQHQGFQLLTKRIARGFEAPLQ